MSAVKNLFRLRMLKPDEDEDGDISSHRPVIEQLGASGVRDIEMVEEED